MVYEATESNAEFGAPPAVGDLAAGQTSSLLPAVKTPTCDVACGGNGCPNEPNTVEVTCKTPLGKNVKASDKAAFQCVPCDVEVDKQISCDGGARWKDIGYDDSVAQACSAYGLNASIKVQYKVQNPTAACELSQCTLTESNTTFGTPPAGGTLTPGQEKTLSAPKARICKDACGTDTGGDCPKEPNTVSVTCKTPLGKEQRVYNSLHMQTAELLRRELLATPGVVITEVPYQVS